MSTTPIALFVFKRPAHTQMTLDALLRNPRLEECTLTIFCDGPRGSDEEAEVAEVRRLIRSYEFPCPVEIVEHDENQGLAQSIIAGVTQLVETHGRVIVLEDDLLLSPYFIDYMLEALQRYEQTETVFHVSGYMFPSDGQLLPETFFLRLGTCWGWGTWRRAWRNFNPDGSALYRELDARSLMRYFDVNGTAQYRKMLIEQIAGRNNSWAIRWYASMVLAGGLGLHPRASLVQNFGFDGTGEHSGMLSQYDTQPSNGPCRVTYHLPAESSAAIEEVARFNRLHNSLLVKISRRFRTFGASLKR